MTTGGETSSVVIGAKLKVAREAAELSQAELAHLLGLDSRTISAYEKGRIRIPAVTLVRVAAIMNRSVDEILALDTSSDGRTIEGKLKRRFLQLQQLGDHRQRAVLQFIEAFLDEPAETVT